MSKQRGNRDYGIKDSSPAEEPVKGSPEETTGEVADKEERLPTEDQQTEEPTKAEQPEKESVVTEPISPAVEVPVITEFVPPVIQQHHPKVDNAMSQLELQLETYQKKMGSKMNQEETSKVQFGLFELYRGILNRENYEDVRKDWNSILKFANANKDKIFNEYHLFRGADAWPGSSGEYTIFRRLNWLIIQTADPKTRKANIPSVNLASISADLRPHEKTNIINFYS